MPLEELRFDRIVDPAAVAFEAIVDLYTRAFPASERKPVTFLTSLLEREDYRLFSLATGGDLAAFAILFQSRSDQFALLEYMAVANDRRGQRWGSRLFEMVANQANGALLLEVENEGSEARGGDERTRRKDFYRRLGCQVIGDLCYRMPKVAASDPPPMEMMIYGFPARVLDKDRLRRWLGEIYGKVYGRAESDPGIEGMLACLPEEISLR